MKSMNKKSQAQFGPAKGAVITLVLVSMLNVMGGAAIAPALPGISQTFPESSETIVSLVITLPSLAVAISGFFVGALADWLGKARTLHISLIVFAITGLLGLVLPNLETLLVGRFIMGIAIAGIATTTGALISEYFDDDMRAKVFGWQSAASGASVLVLETSGGFLSLLGWRAPFLVYLVGVFLLSWPSCLYASCPVLFPMLRAPWALSLLCLVHLKCSICPLRLTRNKKRSSTGRK